MTSAPSPSIGLDDAELVRRLILRDGPIPPRGMPHSAHDPCDYAEFYPGNRCPWCEAEARRVARESAGR